MRKKEVRTMKQTCVKDKNNSKDLDEEFLHVLQSLREIDRKFQGTNDREEMLRLIEEQRPLSNQLKTIFSE